jgi:hypothetical protein
VWNQAVNWLDDYTSIRGTAKVKNASEPGAFVVTFDNPSRIPFPVLAFILSRFLAVQKGDYNVITTNYNDYALVYACQVIPVINVKLEFIWFLS